MARSASVSILWTTRIVRCAVADMDEVPRSAERRQHLVPDAVLVEAAAATMHARHRDSSDHDHIVRGSLRHWHRIIDAVRRDPEGPVARDLADVVEVAEDVGVVARMRRLLASVNAQQAYRDSRQ